MGHDPRKAGDPPASVPAGSMSMPPTAADTHLPPWGGTDMATRVAWLEAQVRSLVATVLGGPQPSSGNLGLRVSALEARQREAAAHDCWTAVFPPDPPAEPAGTTLRANLATLLEAWRLRQRDYLSEHSHTSGQVNRAWLRARHEEAGLCVTNLAEVLAWPDPPSTPVQQAVDEALAEQADQVDSRVVDLIERWERLAREADQHARAAADQVARFEHAAEASVYRAVAQQLRNGGVA